MKAEYDLTNAIKNPRAKLMKESVTVGIDHDTIKYFREAADRLQVPYQTLIMFALRDCALTGWVETTRQKALEGDTPRE